MHAHTHARYLYPPHILMHARTKKEGRKENEHPMTSHFTLNQNAFLILKVWHLNHTRTEYIVPPRKIGAGLRAVPTRDIILLFKLCSLSYI